jgi:hypothetical protein
VTSIPPCKLRQNHAEAQISVAVAGAIVVAVSNATVARSVPVTAAAIHAVRAISANTLFSKIFSTACGGFIFYSFCLVVCSAPLRTTWQNSFAYMGGTNADKKN